MDKHELSGIRVVLNADDLGMHPAQSDAIFDLLSAGMIHSASIMAPCSDFRRAARIAAAHPEYGIGVHATLTNEWQEALPWAGLLGPSMTPSLHNARGLLWPDEMTMAQHANAEEVKNEIRAQIESVLAAGIRPTHLDAHMAGFLQRQDLFETAQDLAAEYKLVIVAHAELLDPPALRRKGLRFPTDWNGFYLVPGEDEDPGIRERVNREWLAGLGEGLHHLYIHPSYDRDDARTQLFDLPIRLADYRIFSSGRLQEFARSRGIALIDYRENAETLEGRSA